MPGLVGHRGCSEHFAQLLRPWPQRPRLGLGRRGLVDVVVGQHAGECVGVGPGVVGQPARDLPACHRVSVELHKTITALCTYAENGSGTERWSGVGRQGPGVAVVAVVPAASAWLRGRRSCRRRPVGACPGGHQGGGLPGRPAAAACAPDVPGRAGAAAVGRAGVPAPSAPSGSPACRRRGSRHARLHAAGDGRPAVDASRDGRAAAGQRADLGHGARPGVPRRAPPGPCLAGQCGCPGRRGDAGLPAAVTGAGPGRWPALG